MDIVRSSARAVTYYEKDDYYLNGESREGGPGGGDGDTVAPGGEGGGSGGRHDADSKTVPGGDSDTPSRGSADEREGEWYGNGAAALGLEGAVARDDFRAVLDGRLPNGVVLGTVRAGGLVHTPGWDLTFTAPKSVSVLIEVGGDERVLDAHNAAVKEALAWTEEHAIGTRRRTFVGRLFETSDSMVAALFTHHTSRNQDPNTHTHAVVANATVTAEGKWKSLFSKALFEHKMASGMVYRAALARELQQLGYDIESTSSDGLFEVPTVPEDLVKLFSSRRQAIEAVLERWGASDAKSAARATLLTRPSKRAMDLGALRSEWQLVAEAEGHDMPSLVAAARERGDVSPSAMDAKIAVRRAIERLAEPEAVFSHAELVRWALSYSIGRARVADVESAITELASGGRLHELNDSGRTQWTTPKALAQEQRALRAIVDGRGQVKSIASDDFINHRLSSTTLSSGQRAAAAMILSVQDRFIGVLGRPGVGKTYLLNEVRQAVQARGYTAVGMAQNANAADQLQKEANIPSVTLHKHLARVGRDAVSMQRGALISQMLLRRQYSKQVWFVDEASQLPSGLMRRLIFNAERLGARVVLVGDPDQLPAIEAGKPFALMLKNGLRHVELDEIRRQKNPEHIAAIRDVIQGDVERAVTRLQTSVVEIKDRSERLRAMLHQYKHLGEERERTLLLTARNQDKATLNEGVRDILRSEGGLKGEMETSQLARVFSRRADRKEASFYQVGDIVRFAAEVPTLSVNEGDYRRIAGVDAKKREVLLESLDGAQRAQWRPHEVAAGSKRSLEIYRPRAASVAPGERIRWTRNVKELNLLNGEQLTVDSVSAEMLAVLKQDGTRVELARDDVRSRHWEHAYASTVYSAQGHTAPDVIANADSTERKLFSRKAFLVAISRHMQSITLFTDDKDELAKTLRKQLGDKSSAVESREHSRWTTSVQALERIISQPWQAPERPEPAPAPDRSRDGLTL